MTRHRRSVAVALSGAALALILAGCASAGVTPPGSAPAAPDAPALPTGDVVGQGTVMDVDGSAEFCVGGVAESYPPQCSGIPLVGWTWDGVEGSETAGGSTWGAYALQGTYDGESFTVTQPPIMLALYDPMPFPDPTGGEAGKTSDAAAAAIADELPSLVGDDFLSSGASDGWVHLQVVWDDGSWQDIVDTAYGEGVVAVTSALRPIQE